MTKPNRPYKIVFQADTIAARVRELGREITQAYHGQSLVLISMLKGSLYFLADLSRAIDLPLSFDLLAVAGGNARLSLTRDVGLDLRGRHVLVVEEIVRTGLTTNFMLQHLEKKEPQSLSLAGLLVNPDQQLIDLPLAYTGFQIGYERLVGYGLDYLEQDRALPFIAELEKDRYP